MKNKGNLQQSEMEHMQNYNSVTTKTSPRAFTK